MSRQRAKGTSWETAIVAYLRGEGFPYAERRAQSGANDCGDITGVSSQVVIEAKNAARVELAAWLDEATTERDNANADIGVAWFKRRGRTSAGAGFVLMDGETFTHILRALRGQGLL